MKKINRNTFIKQSALIGGTLYMNPFQAFSSESNATTNLDEGLYTRLVKANDNEVKELLEKGSLPQHIYIRTAGYNFAKLAAAYCCPESQWFEHESLIAALDKTTDQLKANQTADGTMNAGNLESPPDTAFVMEPLCAGVFILSQKADEKLDAVKEKVKQVILKTGDALTVGGVHTPNHRWVVSQALARINQLYPNQKYIDRINEWLSEGIYMDEDGHYPERSAIYSNVEDTAFITIGRLLNSSKLFNAPRKNLAMTWYYMEPNGDLVTTDSRRQDQYMHKNIVGHYLNYRFLAIHDQDGQFADMTRLIENFPGFEEYVVKNSLFHFMENPVLKEKLPKPVALPLNYERFLKTSGLARIRRGDTTASIFGGTDWPLIIASGRSVLPNFFSYRRGRAVLDYMRLSANFFNTGYFRSEGVQKEGNKYILHKKLEVPYYQPLPNEFKNPDGDYPLTPSLNNRFWSKMAFDKRPMSNVKTLDSSIYIKEDHGKVEVTFNVTGLENVPVTVELCFNKDGVLKGVTDANDGLDNHYLPNGMGTFYNGGDTITFGPGIKKHESIYHLGGEQYAAHFGTLRTEGNHVYLTGITPFKHTLKFS